MDPSNDSTPGAVCGAGAEESAGAAGIHEAVGQMREDPLAFFRGLRHGLAVCIPFWALIIWLLAR